MKEGGIDSLCSENVHFVGKINYIMRRNIIKEWARGHWDDLLSDS